MNALTPEAFENAHDDLQGFLKEDTSRTILESWIAWWYNRKTIVFPAFTKQVNAPRSNLAEVIHAGWEKAGERNLSLMDACAFDVKESYELDLQVKEFESGRFKRGSGPSMAERSRKRSIEQQLQARRYAEQIFTFTAPSSKSSTSATIL